MTNTQDPFFPTGYEVPSAVSDFLNFKENNKYTVRILSKPSMGFEGWITKDGKAVPVRKEGVVDTFTAEEVAQFRPDLDGKQQTKAFWCFLVWNYDAKKIQLMEVTQKTIMNALKNFYDDQRLGDLRGYDIRITVGKRTDKPMHSVTNYSKEEISDEVKKALAETKLSTADIFKTKKDDVDMDDVYPKDVAPKSEDLPF
jgi:hypothetical protein